MSTKTSPWIRARFRANLDDWRPVKWPPPGPYWCTGYGDDYATVVAYLRSEVQIKEYWPEAHSVDWVEKASHLVFSDRFPKPEWYFESVNDPNKVSSVLLTEPKPCAECEALTTKLRTVESERDMMTKEGVLTANGLIEATKIIVDLRAKLAAAEKERDEEHAERIEVLDLLSATASKCRTIQEQLADLREAVLEVGELRWNGWDTVCEHVMNDAECAAWNAKTAKLRADDAAKESQ